MAFPVVDGFVMDDGMAMAYMIAAGENDGETFDWNSMRWEKKN